MQYKGYGLNVEFITSMSQKQWADYSSKEFGFSPEEAAESYAMAVPEKQAETTEEAPEPAQETTTSKRKGK